MVGMDGLVQPHHLLGALVLKACDAQLQCEEGAIGSIVESDEFNSLLGRCHVSFLGERLTC